MDMLEKMENRLKDLKKEKIMEHEFCSIGKNLTMLKLEENYVKSIEKAKLQDVVFELVNKIFGLESLFEKQKIVACINILQNLKKYRIEKNDLYALNLLIKNFKAYHNTQKALVDKNIKNTERSIIITSLITLVFSNFFNNTLKSIYVK
ncbi:hypothetical protein N5T77_10200 [Aliarcobacter cryaerophilus]|uniref:hypothetical protein n=1 Tax=Aliarcobacter cryaerophilus TaxID=28198 RepID=UPI0021B5F7DD|nr:hypothetical protein [Aliarcobacter cryaerophilus]MCT7525420.1 hypothetical protein [Aliarcobacter cryaerophilus]